MRCCLIISLAFLAVLLRADDPLQERGGTLQFVDGSLLHGSLDGIQQTEGLAWRHPAAKDPLKFRLTNLSLLRFEQAQAPTNSTTASCRFQFQNGDELIGNILAIHDNQLRFRTWFGDEVRADISALETIMFSSKGYRLIYEGPTGTNGWGFGRNQRSWEYRDGAFVAQGADLLGRNFGLTGSSTIEFDLSWNGPFSLSITLYTDVIDRFDYSTSAYLLYLGTGSISIQRVQAGAGAIMLGQAQIPDMMRRNKMRFEIRTNKEEATISLFADGRLVQRWRDSSASGFVAKGGGVVFYSQVEPRSLRLSNIRVAEWDGRYEPDAATNLPPDTDIVFLANKDRVFGDVLAVDGGKTTVETKQTRLDIPLERITQIRFAKSAAESNFGPQTVRASFPGGEKIIFDLEEWAAEEVRGVSKTFGALSFHPRNIREVQFNLNRTSPEKKAEASPDFEFLEAE